MLTVIAEIEDRALLSPPGHLQGVPSNVGGSLYDNKNFVSSIKFANEQKTSH